jgi:hypothetical protein
LTLETVLLAGADRIAASPNDGRRRRTMKSWLTWTPRILCLLLAVFLSPALMCEVEKYAAERNCGYIIFVTESERTDAQRFYESLGYKPDTHKGFKRHFRWG